MEAHVRPGWRDAWLPAALLVLGAVELATLGTDGWIPSVGLEAVSAAILVMRRVLAAVVAPASIMVVLLIPLTGTAVDEAATPILFIVVAIFSLGRCTGLRTGIPVLTGTLLVTLGVTAGFEPSQTYWTDVMFIVSLGVPPYFFGRIVRRLDEQGRLLVAQQDTIREQAVQAERDRIARELHDVIAHSISAMVVQTAAAQDLLRSRPERAAQLLDSVTDTGRAALAETGRLLHLVRDEEGEMGLSPAPSIYDLPNLVQSFCDGGDFDVEAELTMPGAPLPSGVDVSTYRVVQEALTNASKHGAGRACLRVLASDHQVQISCTNPVGTTNGGGSGLGLRGMAERVDLLGGRMDTGTTADGDFAVDVTLPVTTVTT